MPTYIGLYYQFMHFNDEAWLKLAALYWDRMARVVPDGYKTADPDAVQRLAEVDFIKDYDPGRDAYALGQLFTDLLVQHASDLQARYRVALRNAWPVLPGYQRPPVFGGPSGSDPRLGYIYNEKLDPTLQAALRDTGLGESDPFDPRWVGMHPALASVYTAALGEQMAESRGFHPVTDETSDYLAISGCTLERLAQILLQDVNVVGPAPTEQEVAVGMAMVALESVVPRNVASLPIEKIIRFRQQHAAEMAAFQAYLHQFATDMSELQQITDPEALQDHFKTEYDKGLSPQLDDLRTCWQSLGIDTVMGAMNVRVALPQLLTSGGAALGLAHVGLNPILGGTGAVVCSVVPIIVNERKAARDRLRSSPAAYLLRLEENLKPASLMSRIGQRARQFFPGV